MSWRFRKYFNFGLFRLSIGNGGLGYSFGIPGLRYNISGKGKKSVSVGLPGTGLSFMKSLDESDKEENIDDNENKMLTHNQNILAKLKRK